MSALTVRPEEEVTPCEAAAMVLSKALVPRKERDGGLADGDCGKDGELGIGRGKRSDEGGGELLGSLILWRALLRTSSGPHSS